MLRIERRLHAPEIGAAHRTSELRTPHVRLSRHEGRRVASDWALVERGSPFLHRMSRTAVSIVLEDEGRFEENGAREWLGKGSIVASDEARGGTEAYAGERSSVLVIAWDPAVLGARVSGAFDHQRLAARDLERVRAISRRMQGAQPGAALLDVLDVLRSVGFSIEVLAKGDLTTRTTADERRLSVAIDEQLSNLEAHPSMDDVADEVGWSSRHVSRRFAGLASGYGLTHSSWKATLHGMRLVTALRMLSVPGATTELVARRTGFRSPSALCHAFAKAGLPSPGTLAQAARRDVLDSWASISDRASAAAE